MQQFEMGIAATDAATGIAGTDATHPPATHGASGFPAPALASPGAPLRDALHRLWHADIRFARSGAQRLWLALASLAGIALWLWPQGIVSDFAALSGAEAVRVFYMVPDLELSQFGGSMATLLLWLAVARAGFVILVGLLDMALYRRITGRPFDWESMINVSIVNAVFIAVGGIALLNLPVRDALQAYDALLERVPTLVDLNGALALVLAALIGDFCFYWSHRLCHGNRFFWYLGHIYHHRNRSLSQLTTAIEPPFKLLQASGALSLLLLPLLSKLFTTDIAGAGIALVVLMVVDTWTDPSHSPAMYWLEARSKALKSLRLVFVTVGVHFMHHARETEGPYRTGCNFGARLTVWDRLFGTYVEPTDHIPDTGLFDAHADTCVNPLRYLLLPPLRMALELRANPVRSWPKILFAPTSYEPPQRIGMSH